MKTYVVGGAVRDELMGLPINDRDHVVVGATPEEMAAAGFKPVGKDFPVFLHPETHEEYALARTERKSGPGYKGFNFHYAPDVTLEDDLRRRDLTINAMAVDEESGELIDPYGGQRDLRAKMLRHVSDAFAEDPVRLLRVARFSARFTDFSIATETKSLMQRLVNDGEVDALVAERVWLELSRGLMEQRPSRMLRALRACGALQRMLPELRDESSVSRALDDAAERGLNLNQRFAIWMLEATDLPAALQKLRAPGEASDLARLYGAHRAAFKPPLTPLGAVLLIEESDGLRKPDRFRELLQIARVVDGEFIPVAEWERVLAAAREVDAGETAASVTDHGGGPQDIKAAVHQARVQAAQRALSESGASTTLG